MTQAEPKVGRALISGRELFICDNFIEPAMVQTIGGIVQTLCYRRKEKSRPDVPIAAYEQAVEASHVFNLLQARGVISVQERASYMGRVRDLARSSCEAYAAKMTPEWQNKYPGWTL